MLRHILLRSHDVGLANTIRTHLGMEESSSAIVTLSSSDPASLFEAGIRVAVRRSEIRLGCHIHNSSSDVEALLSVLDEQAGH